jgi:hypothetical protein
MRDHFERVYTELFNNYGYFPVMNPSDAIKPLDVVLTPRAHIETDGYLMHFGPLQSSLEGTSPPKIDMDHKASNLQDGKITKLDSGINLKFLNNIFARFKAASVAMNAAYQKAATIKTSFENIMIDRIDKEELNTYLLNSKFKNDSLLERELKTSQLGIIYEIIKSNLFVVAALDEAGESLDINIEALMEELGAKGQISAKKGVDKTISYKGDQPLTIGFKVAGAVTTAQGKIKLDSFFRTIGGSAVGVPKMGKGFKRPNLQKKLIYKDSKPTPGVLYEIKYYRPESSNE